MGFSSPDAGHRCDTMGDVRKVLVVSVTTAVVTVALVVAARAFGPASIAFSLLVVWIPMTGLGTISHVVTIRLPDGVHRLRAFERDGRIYERLGVRWFKAFNPGLHLPADRTAASLRRLDDRMRQAEASHGILFVATWGVVLHAAVRGWWGATIVTLLADVAVNGCPVMLQRYNRALLTAASPLR